MGSGEPQGGDTGGVKKTSPMKGKVSFAGDRHANVQTHGHRDYMTESAQWADSVKRKQMEPPEVRWMAGVQSSNGGGSKKERSSY